MRRSMAAWIPGSGEGWNPSSSRFAVRSVRLRRHVARTAYTNILDTTPWSESVSADIKLKPKAAEDAARMADEPISVDHPRRRGIAKTSRSFLNRNGKTPRGLSFYALVLTLTSICTKPTISSNHHRAGMPQDRTSDLRGMSLTRRTLPWY